MEAATPTVDAETALVEVSGDDVIATQNDVIGADPGGIKKSFSCCKEMKDDGVDDLSCKRDSLDFGIKEG
jgi:hypothetical protein